MKFLTLLTDCSTVLIALQAISVFVALWASVGTVSTPNLQLRKGPGPTGWGWLGEAAAWVVEKF